MVANPTGIITPSKPWVWDGTRIEPDDVYTAQQRAWINGPKADRAKHSRRRAGLPECYTHILEIPGATQYSPSAFHHIRCPTIACTRDRARILVVAPNGDEVWLPWKKR